MQTNFTRLVEQQLLNEMPYVLTGKNEKRFDLEFEKFFHKNDFEGFVQQIKDLIDGKKLQDKYKNLAQLSTQEDVKNFIESLKRDKMMPIALWKLFIHWLASISDQTN